MKIRRLCLAPPALLWAAMPLAILLLLLLPVRSLGDGTEPTTHPRGILPPHPTDVELPRGEWLLSIGGRWDPARILNTLSLVSPPPAAVDCRHPAHDAAPRMVIAATVASGKEGLQHLLALLIEKLRGGITFHEPGTEGRPSADISRQMLLRWSGRLSEDRMTLGDLLRLERWLSAFYGDPAFLRPAGQMRLYLTLAQLSRRRVPTIPDDSREVWEFLRLHLECGEFFVAAADRTRDGEPDQWLMLGRDRRGQPYLYVPWSESGPAESALPSVVRADEDPVRFARILKEDLLIEGPPADAENPLHMISRTVFGDRTR